ncbi:hypothetical protein A6E01_20520 (plasmid) [Vibrio breoganii]|uniref:Phosphoadenosine phosphosulphate reductase domain-containing protein n=1 Tax=Vibrio breoganii TaxID=553239 RepID=A0AAN1CUG5_9VIBR|nr:hypothetical protein [Vibrio breoganii]ANO35600.1 hypothetical protein A6E01_20520 [Vibrio breoganii]
MKKLVKKTTEISTVSPEEFERVRRYRQLAESVVNRTIPNWDWTVDLEQYKFIFCGQSGGVDSAALAAVVAIKNPELPITYVFNDTGVEPEAIWPVFERLAMLGVNIQVLGNKTLFDLIEGGNGFLPSARNRSCTSELKIKPYNEFITSKIEEVGGYDDSNESNVALSIAGIRWDERDRVGPTFDGADAEMPFVSQKVSREEVLNIASELELINSSYAAGRSRSGCVGCFYMSINEHIAFYHGDRRMFHKFASYERLPESLLERYKRVPDGFPSPYGYYTCYPQPALLTLGKPHFEQQNLFGQSERVDAESSVTWDWLDKGLADSVRKGELEDNAQGSAILKAKKKAKKGASADFISMFDLEEESPGELLDESEYALNPSANPGNDEPKYIPVDVDKLLNSSLEVVTPESQKKKKKAKKIKPPTEVFEQERVLYVAVEHYRYSGLMSGGSASPIDVWSNRLVVYSPSAAGLVDSLKGYYYHRYVLARASFCSSERYDTESHIAVYAIRFPKGVLPKVNYGGDAFSWFPTRSYAEVAYTIQAIERVCHTYAAKQSIKMHKEVPIAGYQMSRDVEYLESLEVEPASMGEIIGMGHWRPPTLDVAREFSEEEMSGTARCSVCAVI